MKDAFNRLKEQFENLLESCDRELILESEFHDSKWVRVSAFSKQYVVGILNENNENTLCFGLPVFSKKYYPTELGVDAKFIPACKSFLDGFGYYIIFRNQTDIMACENVI